MAFGGLVPYSDSDESDEEKGSVGRRTALPPVPRLTAPGGRDEWLSYVYVPGTPAFDTVPVESPGYAALSRAMTDETSKKGIPCTNLAVPSGTLHLSLTRPLLLRRHEESTFQRLVAEGVAASHVAPYVSG